MSHYYHEHDLPRFGEVGKNAPELWEKFLAWYEATFAEGALTAREKALMALAVAQCRAVSLLHTRTPGNASRTGSATGRAVDWP